VDDGWSRLVVLLLRDPHLLEGRERSQDRTTNPHRVLSFGWRDDLDLHGGWSQMRDFLLHSVGDSRVHGGTTGENGVSVEILSDIDVALHDGVVGGLVDTGGLHTEEAWLEEGLWASESLVGNGDDLTVWELVALLQTTTTRRGVHLLLEIEGNVAQFLFDISDDFTLGSGGEAVASLG